MYSITCKIIYTVVKFEIDICVSQCLGHLSANIISNRNIPLGISICGTAWMHRKINDALSSSYLAISVFWNKQPNDKWLPRDPGDCKWYNHGKKLHVSSLQPTRTSYNYLGTGWRSSARSTKMRWRLKNKPQVCFTMVINTHYKVWDEITYPLPNFKGCTVEIWAWVNNFIPTHTLWWL